MTDNIDQDSLVSQFCSVSGASAEQATQYLEANGWDISAATTSYFQDEEEGDDDEAPPGASKTPAYSGPRTLDGRPAPTSATPASAAASSSSKAKKKGIATLGSLGGSSQQSHQHDDDDDDYSDNDEDDGRGNLFAGGEKSGLAVQDPHHDGRPKKVIDDILAKARANTSRPDGDSETDPAEPTRFRGTGMTLGGDGVESRSIPDPQGASESRGEPQERILHLWVDGFSIDDGELRRFDDPANQADLRMIRSGRAPLHLMNVEQNQPVDLKVHQHEGPYTAPLKKYKPFMGEGQRLGSPVPGSGTVTPQQTAAPVTSSSASAGGTSAAPTVDDSQPTIMIRIQLPNGSRLPARFNTNNTIGDVYEFVRRASADTQTRSWVLATTFPNKEHNDEALVLGDMAEFKKGGTAVVKWT